MRKISELGNPSSCLNRAKEEEYIFVLLGRDEAASATIRFWVTERIRLGKNQEDDKQISEALLLAIAMELER